MNQRIITGILFTLAIALFVVPGYWWPVVPLVMFAAVADLARAELSRALRSHQLELPRVMSQMGSYLFLLPLLILVPGIAPADTVTGLARPLTAFSLLVAGLITWSALTVLKLLILEGPQALPRAVTAMMANLYLVLPMGIAVVILFFVPQGWLWLVLSMASPWISDVFAFFIGSLFGRHKIVPLISPKKTVEGSLGGLLGGVIAAIVLLPLISGLDAAAFFKNSSLILFATLCGIILSVASQLGDWVASGIKRWCAVKDFGHWLPGHGGILDRFDSVLFTLPVTLMLAVLFTYF
jgi:phosphatidate cytidylyltransferase